MKRCACNALPICQSSTSLARSHALQSRSALRWAVTCLLLATAGTSLAAAGDPQTPKTGPMGELRATKVLFRDYAQWLEGQITETAVRRAELKGPARAQADLGLDMRLLCTWATTAQGDDEVLAAAFVRLRQMVQATYLLEQYMTEQRMAGLSPEQSAALARLHELTYKLPEPNSIANLDAASKTIGTCILQAVSAEPGAEGGMPSMRPKTLPATPNFAPPDEVKPATAPARVDPERLLPTLNVSQALRQQMLQIQQALRQAEAAKAPPAEVLALRRMLYDAIDLASGFSANAAIGGEERMELERKLTEALALYVDPRTRGIARSHLDGLSQYRGLVRTIGELHLSPQSYQLLAPAFNHAQRNPDQAAALLASVREFVDMAGQYENLPKEIVVGAQLTRLTPMYQEARKTFEQHRNLYLGAVSGLDGDALTDSTPETLASALGDMRMSFDVVVAMGKISATVDTLNAYKPRPAGGLERRVVREAAVAASPAQGPVRADGVHALQDLIALADSARELAQIDVAALPVEALAERGITRLDELDAKWKANVAQVASDAAAGSPIDHEVIQRNQALPKVIAALNAAAGMQSTLKNAPLLERWADWDGDSETLGLVLTPYASSLNAAVSGFLNDATGPMKELPKAEYASYPLRTLFVRDLMAGSQLGSLPSGLQGVCARLATPFNQFGAERFTSLGITVWARARAAGDVPSAETALKLVCRRIATDMGLKFDENRASFATAMPKRPTSSTDAATSDKAAPARNGKAIGHGR